MKRLVARLAAALLGLLIACSAIDAAAGPWAFRFVKGAASGGSASTLPSGALAVWYADQYDSTTLTIPNAASASPTAAKKNYLRAPRRLFSKAVFWGATNVTVTDDAVTGPDGLTEASTVVSTATGWNVNALNGASLTLPAGQYTMALYIRSHDGTTQTGVRFGDNQSTKGTFTVTTSWQRITQTFTTTGTVQPILQTPSVATNNSLEICDWELYAGASDLGPIGADENLYLSTYYGAVATPVASNEIDFSVANSRALALLSSASTLTQFTAIAVIKRVSSANDDYVLTRAQNYQNLTLTDSILSNFPGGYVQGALSGTIQNTSGMSLMNGQGYHVHVLKSTGTNVELWVDDVKVFNASGVMTSTSIRDLLLGSTSSGGTSGFKMYAAGIWGSALSDTNTRSAVTYLSNKATAASLTMATGRFLAAEGDSITYWTGNPQTYPFVYGANATPKFIGRAFAQPGNTLADLVNRAATVDAMIPPNPNGRKFILSVLIGHNDLVGYSGGTNAWLAALASYLDARRSAGWTVVLCTLLPSTVASFNTTRAPANTEMRLWTTSGSIVPGKHADYICDFAADATMGPDAAASNATYYSDGTHPTQTGQNTLEPVYRAVVNGIP